MSTGVLFQIALFGEYGREQCEFGEIFEGGGTCRGHNRQAPHSRNFPVAADAPSGRRTAGVMMIQYLMIFFAFSVAAIGCLFLYRTFFRKLGKSVIFAYVLSFLQMTFIVTQYFHNNEYFFISEEYWIINFLSVLIVSSFVAWEAFGVNDFPYPLSDFEGRAGISMFVGFPVLGIFIVFVWNFLIRKKKKE